MNIKQWLRNPKRKYADGLAIYNKHKSSNYYDDFFSSITSPEPSSIHFSLLVSQVAKILRKIENNPAVEPAITAAKPSKKITTSPTTQKLVDEFPEFINVNDQSPEVKKAFLDRKSVFVELAGAKQTMLQAKTDQERSIAATRVAQLNTQLNALNDSIKTFVANADKPEDSPAVSVDPVKEALEISAKIKNLKAFILRANAELKSKKLSPSKVANRNKSLVKWADELSILENKLQSLT